MSLCSCVTGCSVVSAIRPLIVEALNEPSMLAVEEAGIVRFSADAMVKPGSQAAGELLAQFRRRRDVPDREEDGAVDEFVCGLPAFGKAEFDPVVAGQALAVVAIVERHCQLWLAGVIATRAAGADGPGRKIAPGQA